MNLLTAATSLLLLATGGSTGSDLPPLECLDAAGRVLPDAVAPRLVTPEVTPPQVIKRVKLDYRKLAGPRKGGVIILESLVDRRGVVCAARILGKRNDAATQEALDTLRQWRFKPALVDGTPVPAYFLLTINIDLQ